MSYDLSFDAKSVVFSARIPGEDKFHIFSMNLDGTNLQQLTTGANDYVYPLYLPGDQILFMTNQNVEADTDPMSQQFHDEYERAVTAQVGTMNVDGSKLTLGPRNVSHRVSPALLPDGHVLYTEWMHMGGVNTGHLRMMNTDMTGMKEAFGDELASGNASANSYLKARYVSSNPTMVSLPDGTQTSVMNYQVIAIATSRDRTLQAGELMLVDLNGSEATSVSHNLTPLVPARPHAEPAGHRPLLRRRAGGRRGARAVPGVVVGRPRRVRAARPRQEHRRLRRVRVRRQQRRRADGWPLAHLQRSASTGTSCRAR